jgi:hypothetical protein
MDDISVVQAVNDSGQMVVQTGDVLLISYKQSVFAKQRRSASMVQQLHGSPEYRFHLQKRLAKGHKSWCRHDPFVGAN